MEQEEQYIINKFVRPTIYSRNGKRSPGMITSWYNWTDPTTGKSTSVEKNEVMRESVPKLLDRAIKNFRVQYNGNEKNMRGFYYRNGKKVDLQINN